jgi:SAM-dependent methyltransferase
MTPQIRGWIERCAPFVPTGPVVEVGSLWVPEGGGQALADMRPLFGGRPFLGVDLREGPGVDLMADAEALPLPGESYGVVLCLDTIEHVARPWRAYSEMYRVLRPGGLLLTSTVFWCGVHSHPCDYWRCTPDGMRIWLEEFPMVWAGSDSPDERSPRIVVGAGLKGTVEIAEEIRAGWFGA